MKNSIKQMLFFAFMLSLASIFIALWIVAMSIQFSPIPQFPMIMVEHMWKFFLVIPIPLASAILGCIYAVKGYPCKKNIIAGVIMVFFLCLYGSFAFVFGGSISHDMDYLQEISETVAFDFPSNGYIAVEQGFFGEGTSMAMVKIDQEESAKLVSRMENDAHWKRDLSFVPSTAIDMFTMSLIADYEYFAVYNTTSDTYNQFPGELIFMAFDVETNVICIVCQK